MATKKTAKKAAAKPRSFAQHVWDTMSKVDISDHTKTMDKTAKRPEVTYLPWHKAIMLLKRHFPASHYRRGEDIIYEDGSMEVEVILTVSDGYTEEMVSQTTLPVMNFHFNAIMQPDARMVNDSRQRCVTKAVAITTGLGLSLWDQSIVPVGKLSEPITGKQLEKLHSLLDETGTNYEAFSEWCGVDHLVELPYEKFKSAERLLQSKKDRS
jgi:hypothetical protein